jgi:hypothetical protein
MNRLPNARLASLFALLFAFLLVLPTTAAAEDDAAWHEQREAEAEDNFQTIMSTNAMDQSGFGGSAPASAAPRGGMKGRRSRSRPQVSPQNVPAQAVTGSSSSGGVGVDPVQVEVPLARWEATRRAVEAAREEAEGPSGPLVVLGGASYSGESRDGALALRLDLQVTLDGDGLWKTVPLVGEQVVVVGASANGRALPLTSRNGYHVWVTKETGERTLTLDLLVPARGRRGSLEYEFLVARTPVTQVAIDFPQTGLEPRLRGAVQAEVRAVGGGTHLEALLSPTSRVHLVGFKDLGDDSGREARVYAESLNLLSIDEAALELFTVVRYHILYAGQRQFDVRIPPGMSVVSADGEGAFRYTVEDLGVDGAVLRGETAFPIRNEYEISLRLRRDDPGSGEPFVVTLPQCVDVEREYGWLGVEVTGTLQLEEMDRQDALAVDVRQLPWEMVQSAVSPILRAWRYHSSAATITLRSTALPDVEPASASIDEVLADTVVSAEGRVLTDVRITLRNRLRHSLRVTLPEGASVRSTLLDGAPVKPSRAADGALLFPLERSAETVGGLAPFTLQVVIESEVPALGLVGQAGLALPALELPVSSLVWTVYLPANNDYTELKGDVHAQYMGSRSAVGQWYKGSGFAQGNAEFGGVLNGFGGQPPQTGHSNVGSADSGAMPVRIDLPKRGRTLRMHRYWIEGGHAVAATAWHWRSWLLAPLSLFLFLLLGGGMVGAVEGHRAGRLPGQRLGFAVGGVVALALALMTLRDGSGAVVLAGMLAGAALFLRGGLHRSLVPAMRSWLGGDGAPPPVEGWASRSVLGRLGLVLFTGGVLMMVFIATLRWMTVMGNPL